MKIKRTRLHHALALLAASMLLEATVLPPQTSAASRKISDCDVQLSYTRYYYDGNLHTPRVTVIDRGEVLRKGRDYTLSYSNARGPGSSRIRISGCGSYTGERRESYEGLVRPPTGVTCSYHRARTRLRISWSPSGKCERYFIRVRLDDSGFASLYTTGTKADLVAERPGTYLAQVTALQKNQQTGQEFASAEASCKYTIMQEKSSEEKKGNEHAKKTKKKTTGQKNKSSQKASSAQKTCRIVFHPCGGSDTTRPQVVKLGSRVRLHSCQYDRYGYDFAGWALHAGGAPAYADNGWVKRKQSSTLHLYACWQKNAVGRQVDRMMRWCDKVAVKHGKVKYRYHNIHCEREGGFCRFCRPSRKKAYFCNSYVIAACVHGLGYRYGPFVSDCRKYKGHGSLGQVKRCFYPAVDHYKGWIRVDIGTGNLKGWGGEANRKRTRSYLRRGDVLMLGSRQYRTSRSGCRGHYQHTAIYYGDSKITECAGNAGCVTRDMKYMKRGSRNRRVIEVFRYMGEMGTVKIRSCQAAKGGFTLSWNAAENVFGYQIQYSRSRSFHRAKTVNVIGFTAYKASGCKSHKTYYVRMRPYQKSNGVKYPGPWMAVKRVKTK